MKAKVEEKQKEVDEMTTKLLKMKDERMDFEASIDKKHDMEKHLQADAVALQEQLAGKDQAISALGKSLMEKAKEHEKISEMFNLFKNRLIQENCFHTNYGAKKLKQSNSIINLSGGPTVI